MTLFVLIFCASLHEGGCSESKVAFDSLRSCEVARLALKSEFDYANCRPWKPLDEVRRVVPDETPFADQ
jgi:hypothetical protein